MTIRTDDPNSNEFIRTRRYSVGLSAAMYVLNVTGVTRPSPPDALDAIREVRVQRVGPAGQDERGAVSAEDGDLLERMELWRRLGQRVTYAADV